MARLLKADEIECRVGQFTKNKDKYSVLLYKTSRTDMSILDEMYGPSNWQVTYHTIGNSLYCQIAVWDEDKGMWVGKMSNGSESNIEAEKGQASDAFKRAGFMWGIGRELYTAPKIWLDASVNQYDLEVTDIGYNDKNEINRLVICSKGTVVYEMGKRQTQSNPKPQTSIDTAKKENIVIGSPEASEDSWKMYWYELKKLCPDEEQLKAICKANGVDSAKKLNGFYFNAIRNILTA